MLPISNRLLLAILGGAALCGALKGFWDTQRSANRLPPIETEAKAFPTVSVQRIDREDFQDTLSFIGKIGGLREIELKFETSGAITSYNYKEGEKIEKDAVIASLDKTDERLKLKYHEVDLDTQRRLFELGAITRSRLEQAQAEYELAKGELAKTDILAPYAGVLGYRKVDVGEVVVPGQSVGTLINTDEVFVEVDVIEEDLTKLARGQKVKVLVDTFPGMEFRGAVENLSRVIEGRSRTAKVKAKIEDPDSLLLPGMFARAEVVIHEERGALVVPSGAFDFEDGEYYLWIVNRGSDENLGIVERRPVEIGYFTDDYLVVKKGVSGGELLISEPVLRISEGEKVRLAGGSP